VRRAATAKKAPASGLPSPTLGKKQACEWTGGRLLEGPAGGTPPYRFNMTNEWGERRKPSPHKNVDRETVEEKEEREEVHLRGYGHPSARCQRGGVKIALLKRNEGKEKSTDQTGSSIHEKGSGKSCCRTAGLVRSMPRTARRGKGGRGP